MMHGALAVDPVPVVDVALPVPVPRCFTYEIPPELSSRVAPGVRAVCPLGSRRLVGVVLASRTAVPLRRLKPIVDILDEEPTVPPDLVAFAREVAEYYLSPIGEVMRFVLPPQGRAAEAASDEPLFQKPRGAPGRLVLWAAPVSPPGANGAKLSPKAIELLGHLRTAGPQPVARLSETWSTARAQVKRLAALGLLVLEERPAPDPPPFATEQPREQAPVATPAQREAIGAIEVALTETSPSTFLLHGVTGSGKTEVYLQAIARAQSADRGTIVLVPEIALTPQLVARYRARFGDTVAVLHSGLSHGERQRMWRRLREGSVIVAMGARSALFAPVRSLGLVIVDEEHDPSFKQEEGVRYHARDMAILRAHRASGVCVLGSATPSLESEWLARSGKAKKLILPDRARAQVLPRVELIDLRRIGPGPTGDRRLSLPLHRAIDETLAAGEQVILFLNRRGFAPSVRCAACGNHATCPSCSVALTFHRREGALLRCHYCGYAHAMTAACGACGAGDLLLEGVGTERLEDTLRAAFPTARIARLDRDVASGKAAEAILAKVRGRQVDILVGTQMVTKGHDLPHVTLVGVINADAALSIPDFRASERGFQLLVQVAGRAGRGTSPGRVLVQTYNPEHPAMVHARLHDVPGFIERELADRKELGYPPFARVALVRADAVEERAAREACETMARLGLEAGARARARVAVVGPAPAPLTRLRNRYRYHVMLRSSDRRALRGVLIQLDQARAALPRAVRCAIDVDPMQLL